MSPTLPPVVNSGAVYDASKQYRYSLWRTYTHEASHRCLWVMLNPSTATAIVNDPTVRRCQGFGLLWGFDHVRVVNIFAYRSTDPQGLRAVADPVGPENDDWLRDELDRADLVVCAWGQHGQLRNRSASVRSLLAGRKAWCFDYTASGEPVHPLYQPSTSPLIRFQ